MQPTQKSTFLTAQWLNLIFANYEIEPKILKKYLPFGTELDLWQGKCFVSVVGFDFRETAVLGIKFPFHTNFEEVNLRFYVRYKDGNNWKRGAVFIKEIVPRAMITFIANTLYKENYATHKTKKLWQITDNELLIRYEWLNKKHWNLIEVKAEKEKQNIIADSEAEFITEHYWGYAKANEDQTTEYEVVHPKWQIHAVKDYRIEADFVDLYGENFSFLVDTPPSSVFLADGSPVAILRGKSITSSSK